MTESTEREVVGEKGFSECLTMAGDEEEQMSSESTGESHKKVGHWEFLFVSVSYDDKPVLWEKMNICSF